MFKFSSIESFVGQFQSRPRQPDNSPLSPLWLMLWAMLLACPWLLPNHFPPWSAFHADAWMGIAMALGAIAVAWRVPGAISWRGLPLVVALLVAVPWLQYGAGMLPFRGQAWMSSLYLLGFLLALQVGAAWEAVSPDQLTKALFIAIGIAALVSVWLQLYTWLGQWDGAVTDIWSMGYSGARPYANLGQPNQLATLLIWAILACLWANVSGVLGKASAVSVAAFLLFGLALTQSRMGWLALTAVLAGIWFWRSLWPDRRLPWIVSGLYAYFWLCPFVLRWLHSVVMQGDDASFLRLQEQGELRLSAWRLFVHAALERPWTGYGWTELASVQLAVANQMPAIPTTFGHSHNLFLDLVLWCGLPLGLLLTGVLLRWFWIRLRAVKTPQEAALFMVLGAVGIHAMVELPLHYAYFLLPVGLIIGALEQRLHMRPVLAVGRNFVLALWLCMAALLSIFIRDYIRVEDSYRTLRFEWASIKTAPAQTPDVLLLTQWRDYFTAVRLQPKAGMDVADVTFLRDLAGVYPNTGLLQKLAKSLALNDEPAEAALWLTRACQMVPRTQCVALKQSWAAQSQDSPKIAAANWPGE